MLNEVKKLEKFRSAEEMLRNAKKGVYSKVSYLSECRMNKRNNPFYGRVLKLTVYNSVKFGISYANIMERQAEKAGNAPDSPYIVNTNTGKGNWVTGLKDILTRNEETGKEYLHIAIYPESKVKSFYLLDGELLNEDDKVLEEVKSWDNSLKRANKPCEKQEDYGMTKETFVKTPTLILANVVGIKQGNKIYLKNDNQIFDRD